MKKSQAPTVHSDRGASSMYRWEACPGSVALCRTVPPMPSSKYAAEGTEAHEVGAVRIQSGKWPAGVDPEMREAVTVYVDLIEKEKPRNGAAGTLLIEHPFDLSKIHPGLFGTCDAVIFDSQARVLRVYDYKHGAGIPVEVERNSQLMYYGLGALLSTSFPCEWVELIIVQPRCAHKDGPIRRWKFPSIELLDFAADLKDAALATEEPNAPLNPGDHCRFCSAQGVCPAIEARAKAAAQDEFDVIAVKGGAPYDSKQLAEKLKWFPVVEAYIEGVRQFAYAEAMAGRTPPGWKLVAKRATRKWRDEAEVIKFLEREFSDSTTRELFDPPTLKSVAQVEKVLHKNQHEKLAPFVAAISSGEALVPENDPRPAVKPALASDQFTSIEDDIFA
jgi:hypothetical protein